MGRKEQLEILRAEVESMFSQQLDASVAYYSAEYKSAAQSAALDESTSFDSAVREMRIVYSSCSGKDFFAWEIEIADSARKLRALGQVRGAELIEGALARVLEAISVAS